LLSEPEIADPESISLIWLSLTSFKIFAFLVILTSIPSIIASLGILEKSKLVPSKLSVVAKNPIELVVFKAGNVMKKLLVQDEVPE
jgi:hypothetical protein